MNLTINGEPRSFEKISTLNDLIEMLGLKGDRVAVELNRNIVARADWPTTKLNEADKLEIVHFVGGGRRPSFTQTQPRGSPAKP